MNTRNIISAALCTLAVTGGGAAMAAPSADAATSHQAAATVSQAAGTPGCIIFSETYVSGVRLRTSPNDTSSRNIVTTAKPGTPYTSDRCTVRDGSWYHACGLTSDKWEQIRTPGRNGKWYWSAKACWAPTIRL